MSMANEAGILLAYAIGMFGLFVVVCMFIVPLKYAVRFLISSLLGGIAIVVINLAGAAVGIHISLNCLTAAATGVLGVPGVLMLLFFQNI